MNYFSIRYLELVPGKLIKGGDENCIYIFSYKRNGKIRKKKKDLIGFVAKHPKAKEWCAKQSEKSIWGKETMCLITTFIAGLDSKIIKFNPEKGELTK